MSRQTVINDLPESMREHIRDLERGDQDLRARKRIHDLIEDGLASGPGRRRTKADGKELLAIARGEID